VADHFQYLASLWIVALRGLCAVREQGSLTILTWRQSAMYTDVETWTPSSVCWSHSAKSVGTACDGRALVDLAASTRPDVIVLDI
jgi:hypothetical protein